MRSRGGFTLIELLIVILIIGVMASIAVARFGAVKGRAYVAAMQSDLRNAMAAQVAYAEEQTPPAFALDVATLGSRFRASAGVTVIFPVVTSTGFSVLATHNATSIRCAIFQGAAITLPATVEGQIACD